MFEDIKELIMSFVVNNGKVKIMKMFNLLVWNFFNILIDMMCWEVNIYKMIREEEMEFFNIEIIFVLNGLYVLLFLFCYCLW